MRRLVPAGSRSEWRDASGLVQLCEVHVDSSWYGRPATLVEKLTPARLAFITRLGEGLIPDENTVLQEGDLVHVMVTEKDLPQVDSILSKTPEEH